MKKFLMLLPGLLICFALTAQTSFPSSQTDGQYYTINGAKLWVVTVGTGEPLISGRRLATATHTVHLGEGDTSRLVLPAGPRPPSTD